MVPISPAAIALRAKQQARTSKDSAAAPARSRPRGLLRQAPRFAHARKKVFPARFVRYVRKSALGARLKYRALLPLFEDLSKFSHNKGLATARIALVVAASVTAAGARDVHSDLSVSVTVRAVAHLEIKSAPAELAISTSDLQRGFIAVAQPTQLTVRSNSPSGFALDVLTVASPMVSSMVVEGLNSDQALGADGGTIVQRWERPQAVNLSLKFRFALAPGLSPGNYPWPLRLTVRPLD
jgi:hypothetical protein